MMLLHCAGCVVGWIGWIVGAKTLGPNAKLPNLIAHIFLSSLSSVICHHETPVNYYIRTESTSRVGSSTSPSPCTQEVASGCRTSTLIENMSKPRTTLGSRKTASDGFPAPNEMTLSSNKVLGFFA